MTSRNAFSICLAGSLTVLGCQGSPRPPRHAHGAHGGRHKLHHPKRPGDPTKMRFVQAAKWAKRFENPSRDQWQKPAIVLAALTLLPTHRVADIGSATGYFTVRIARAVPQGRVWGIDVQPDMVRWLNRRASRETLPQLVSRLGTFSDPLIPRPVDRVFICNTYHHIGSRVAYFKALRVFLKPGARLVIVDFKAGKLPIGPPENHRVLPPALHAELTAAGYTRVSLDTKSLPYQYIATYK